MCLATHWRLRAQQKSGSLFAICTNLSVLCVLETAYVLVGRFLLLTTEYICVGSLFATCTNSSVSTCSGAASSMSSDTNSPPPRAPPAATRASSSFDFCPGGFVVEEEGNTRFSANVNRTINQLTSRHALRRVMRRTPCLPTPRQRLGRSGGTHC